VQQEEEYLDSPLSITFGAPHLCNKAAATIINSNPLLNWRFINFVNGTDPVPRLLHHLQSTLGAATQHLLHSATWTLREAVGAMGRTLESSNSGSAAAGIRTGAREVARMSHARVALKLTDNWHKHRVELRKDPQQSFYPFGLYAFIEREDEQVKLKCRRGEAASELLEAVELDSDSLALHNVRSYRIAVSEVAGSLMPDITKLSLGGVHRQSLITTTPVPMVR
jgi:hypothetical protein